MFPIREEGNLVEAVRVFVVSGSATVDVDVIPDYQGLDDYVFEAKGSKQVTYPGWYTIELDEPVHLASSGSFAAAVRVDVGYASRSAAVGIDYNNVIGEGESSFLYNPSLGAYEQEPSNSPDANFNIKAIARVSSDSKLAEAAASLTADSILGENPSAEEVTTALMLPDVTEVHGADVVWSSDLPDVIDPATGAVTRAAEDTVVTLTAEITLNGATTTKQFPVTVLRLPSGDAEAIAEARAALTWDLIRGENEEQDKVWIDLMLQEVLVTDSGAEVAVTWTSTDEAVVDPTSGAVEWRDLWKTADVELTALLTFGEGTATIRFPLTVHGRAGGRVGSNCDLYWELNGATRELRVYGEGKMVFDSADYGSYTSIDNPWLDYLSIIRSVVIEEGVTSLEPDAFANASALEQVRLPASLERIGDGAFGDCPKLHTVGPAWSGRSCSIVYSWTDAIPASAFSGANSIVEATVGEGMTEICEAAFLSCESLGTVHLPDSLRYVGKDAFDSCDALQTVTYGGSRSQWEKVTFADGNVMLRAVEPEYGAFDVVFDANGGSGSMEAQIIKRGWSLMLPECAFAGPDGASFLHWTIDGVGYQPYEYYDPQDDLTVTAAWREAPAAEVRLLLTASSAVVRDADGGTVETDADGVGALRVQSGQLSFTITCGRACTVLLKTTENDAEQYEAVPAQHVEGNTYRFTADVPAGAEIIVALKGDVNGDGLVNTVDVTILQKAALRPSNPNYVALSGLGLFKADINGDGRTNAADVTGLQKAALRPSSPNYVPFAW